MTKQTVLDALGSHPWAGRLTVLDTVDSTNTYAKTLAASLAPHGTVVIADHQTGGRGRLGRRFSSPKGLGLYLSCIWRFDAPPDRLMHLTCMAAEAARRAVGKACRQETSIKWTNDLVVGKRKLCGILTEMVHTPAGPAVICGVGVNCLQQPEDLPPEIRETAVSLAMLGAGTDRQALGAELIRQLALAGEDMLTCPMPWMQAYRSHCITLGQDVKIVRGDETRFAHVDGMDDQGALLVTLQDGTKAVINSGEVSVRGMYGYL